MVGVDLKFKGGQMKIKDQMRSLLKKFCRDVTDV